MCYLNTLPFVLIARQIEVCLRWSFHVNMQLCYFQNTVCPRFIHFSSFHCGFYKKMISFRHLWPGVSYNALMHSMISCWSRSLGTSAFAYKYKFFYGDKGLQSYNSTKIIFRPSMLLKPNSLVRIIFINHFDSIHSLTSEFNCHV